MDSASACFDYLAEQRALVRIVRAEVGDCKEVVALQQQKAAIMVADSTKQAEANAVLAGQNAEKDKRIKQLERKGKLVGAVVYIASTLAVVFGLMAAIK